MIILTNLHSFKKEKKKKNAALWLAALIISTFLENLESTCVNDVASVLLSSRTKFLQSSSSFQTAGKSPQSIYASSEYRNFLISRNVSIHTKFSMPLSSSECENH